MHTDMAQSRVGFGQISVQLQGAQTDARPCKKASFGGKA
jgi:hypothetical protein